MKALRIMVPIILAASLVLPFWSMDSDAIAEEDFGFTVDYAASIREKTVYTYAEPGEHRMFELTIENKSSTVADVTVSVPETLVCQNPEITSLTPAGTEGSSGTWTITAPISEDESRSTIIEQINVDIVTSEHESLNMVFDVEISVDEGMNEYTAMLMMLALMFVMSADGSMKDGESDPGMVALVISISFVISFIAAFGPRIYDRIRK